MGEGRLVLAAAIATSPLEWIAVGGLVLAAAAGIALALKRPREDSKPGQTPWLVGLGWGFMIPLYIVIPVFILTFPIGGLAVSRGWVKSGVWMMGLSALFLTARLVEAALA